MKNRDYRLFFNDILECASNILEYTKGMNFNDFMDDQKTREAVERNIEIMGEAVKHIPEGFKERFNNIPYREIAGMRNILIHNYLGIDYQKVWNVIENRLPNLKTQVEIVLKELE